MKVDLLKIFRRKRFYQKLHKTFPLKTDTSFSDEVQRRSSQEWDLVLIFIKELREISFFGRSQKRFGFWVLLLPKHLYLMESGVQFLQNYHIDGKTQKKNSKMIAMDLFLLMVNSYKTNKKIPMILLGGIVAGRNKIKSFRKNCDMAILVIFWGVWAKNSKKPNPNLQLHSSDWHHSIEKN